MLLIGAKRGRCCFRGGLERVAAESLDELLLLAAAVATFFFVSLVISRSVGCLILALASNTACGLLDGNSCVGSGGSCGSGGGGDSSVFSGAFSDIYLEGPACMTGVIWFSVRVPYLRMCELPSFALRLFSSTYGTGSNSRSSSLVSFCMSQVTVAAVAAVE